MAGQVDPKNFIITILQAGIGILWDLAIIIPSTLYSSWILPRVGLADDMEMTINTSRNIAEQIGP